MVAVRDIDAKQHWKGQAEVPLSPAPVPGQEK
jgi:hypothetical protein